MAWQKVMKIVRWKYFIFPISLSVIAAVLSLGPVGAGAQTMAAASVLQPLTPPAQPPNLVPLSTGEQLGKDIFYDATLSNPEGYSCATCHVPQSGFTGPSSTLNNFAGPVPGLVPGRFGRRNPQPIPYASFSPRGPYLSGVEGGTYVGGLFWDGRTPDTATQARMPFLDQNEMANVPVGPYPPHAGGFSPLLAQKLAKRPYADLFENLFGHDVFQTSSEEQVYDLVAAAIAVYEASAEINQFSSKYDASTNGVPPMHLYTFTPAEENGRILFFGKAQCFECHSSTKLDSVNQATHGKDTFTMYCYANLGVPKNPGNPFYANTNCDSNPHGCNPLGADYIDYGLGANPNPAPDGTMFMDAQPGDFPQFDGLFKAPSLRNTDQRPSPYFVRSYMHNGVFKSLEEVVHFYNKRSIATNSSGQEVAFNWKQVPPAGYMPIFPPPESMEFPANVQNIAALTPVQFAALAPDAGAVANNGQVGNLQLTPQEEADLVSFLKTLTDGYMRPNAVSQDLLFILKDLPSPPASGSLMEQLKAEKFFQYMAKSSANPPASPMATTNVQTTPVLNLTNLLMPRQSP
jgi:cytochrome c peroxidase